MLKILVTGKNGQLGSSLQDLSSSVNGVHFIFTGSAELNIIDAEAVEQIVREQKPDVVINCSAYTAVDLAEDEPDKADLVNHIGVRNLAIACKKYEAALIHISTDYVFDGKKTTPYEVDDQTNPMSVYGKTKLDGELAMREINPKGCIIRTSWVYSQYGGNFVKTMLRLGKEKTEINVVADQFGSPTYGWDLANVCVDLALRKGDWPSQVAIYHFSNHGEISWFDFATEIMNQAGLNCKVNPIATSQYPTKAKRPEYSIMKNSMDSVFVFNYKDSLKKALKQLLLP